MARIKIPAGRYCIKPFTSISGLVHDFNLTGNFTVYYNFDIGSYTDIQEHHVTQIIGDSASESFMKFSLGSASYPMFKQDLSNGNIVYDTLYSGRLCGFDINDDITVENESTYNLFNSLFTTDFYQRENIYQLFMIPANTPTGILPFPFCGNMYSNMNGTSTPTLAELSVAGGIMAMKAIVRSTETAIYTYNTDTSDKYAVMRIKFMRVPKSYYNILNTFMRTGYVIKKGTYKVLTGNLLTNFLYFYFKSAYSNITYPYIKYMDKDNIFFGDKQVVKDGVIILEDSAIKLTFDVIQYLTEEQFYKLLSPITDKELKNTKYNCYSIMFYTGVPFEDNKEDVLFFNSIDERNTWLEQYKMYELVDNTVLKLVFYEGQNTLYIPYVNDIVDLTDCNYIRVRFYNGRELFYYVNSSFTAIQKDYKLTWNMNISMDYFQSYFNKGNYLSNKLDYPILKEVNYNCGHNLDGDKLSLLEGTISTSQYQSIEIAGFEHQKLVCSAVTSKGDFIYFQINLSDNNITTLTDLFSYINTKLSRVYRLSESENITLGNVYIIPTVINSLTTGKIYNLGYYADDGNTQIIKAYELQMYKQYTVDSTTYYSYFTFNLNSDIEKIVKFGLKYNNIELPVVYGKTFECRISLTMDGLNYQILLECGGQSIDIAPNLQFPLAYNEERQYYLNHQEMIDSKLTAQEMSAMTSIINNGIKTAGSTASAGISVAAHTMSAKGLAGGITGMLSNGVNTINSIVNYSAVAESNKDYYKFNTKSSVQGSKGVLFNLDDNLTSPIKVWHLPYSNATQIEYIAQHFGYTTHGFYHELDLSQNKPTNFRYLQCECTAQGKYYKIAQRSIEEMFSRGVRIWYNPDNFLKDVEP